VTHNLTPRERVKRYLREVNVLPWTPEEPDKPDIPTVEFLDEDVSNAWHTPLRLQCANQCVRDSDHDCGVQVDVTNMIDGTWVHLAAQQIPWMVLSWGPHLHQLPFCCTSCLIEFVDRRATLSEARQARSR